MTNDNNDTTEAEQADEQLHPGYFTEDREDSGTLVVIADTMKEAKNHTVQAAGETVAELNPAYPEDDVVLFAAYRNELDSAFGDSWRGWTSEYLAFQAGDRGIPVYSFPESRLERKPDEWEDDEQRLPAGAQDRDATADDGGEADE